MARRIYIGFSNQWEQTSLINYLCSEWTENDCVYFLEQTHPPSGPNEWSLSVPVEQLIIPKGNSESEIWEIFDTVYTVFQTDDEINMDITSCPPIMEMLMISLLQYAKILKNIRVKSIYCWKQDDSNTLTSIDLTAFSDIQDWLAAANDFIHFGRSKKLHKITQKQIAPILKKSHGDNEAAEKLMELNNHIENLNLDISTNRSNSLIEGKNSNRILEIIHYLRKYLIKPLIPILDKFEKSFRNLHHGNNEKENILATVQWCIDKRLIQDGFTLLQEGIISHLLIVYNDKIRRDFAMAYLNGRFQKNFNENLYPAIKPEVKKEIKQHLEAIHNIDEWSQLFMQITKIRNDIHHGGMNFKSTHANHFEMKLIELYEKTKELLNTKQKNSAYRYSHYKEFYY